MWVDYKPRVVPHGHICLTAKLWRVDLLLRISFLIYLMLELLSYLGLKKILVNTLSNLPPVEPKAGDVYIFVPLVRKEYGMFTN